MKCIHITNKFPDNKEKPLRFSVAEQSWKYLYSRGVIPCHIDTYELDRNSKSIGDDRELPFIKDLINYGIRKEDPDVIIFSNADICFFQDSVDLIDEALYFNDCIYSKRINFKELTEPISKKELPLGKEEEYGIDMFAFKKDWWIKISPYFPDLLLACEGWDTFLECLAITSNPNPEVKNLTYHQEHPSFWNRTENRYTNAGQLHNLSLIDKTHPAMRLLLYLMKSYKDPIKNHGFYIWYQLDQLLIKNSNLFDSFISKNENFTQK